MRYDLIIIGGGPAGYNAAERASERGLSVLLFEEREVGGVCLNEGCIPAKTLLNSAKIMYSAQHAASYGVMGTGNPVIEHKAVLKRKTRVVAKLVGGIKYQLKNAGVTFVKSSATILGKGADGFGISANGNIYTADKLLIATGSETVVPPIDGVKEGLENGFVLTNKEVLSLAEIPSKFVVIGGGVIGLETAAYYNAAGSEVTVIEMLDKIAGSTDAEISEILQKSLEEKGIKFYLSTKVNSVNADNVMCENAQGIFKVQANKVLLSVGRRPRTAGLGLENIGVITKQNAVVTDQQMRTSAENVYAAGDVNGKSMLAHTAYREAEVAVNTMLGTPDNMNYSAVPSVIYTSPEVASVGETMQSAIDKKIKIKSARLPLTYSGRYVAENIEQNGICKLVIETETDKILGVQVIGPCASEFIVAAASYVDLGLTADRVKKIVFPHPTVSEILRETLFAVKE